LFAADDDAGNGLAEIELQKLGGGRRGRRRNPHLLSDHKALHTNAAYK